MLEVGLGEGGADEIEVLGGDEEGLVFVVEVGFEVELAGGGVDEADAYAGSVGLLEGEGLGEVVVERGAAEGEEARAKVLILLGLGVEDVGFGGGGAGLGDGAVGLGVVDGCAGAWG